MSAKKIDPFDYQRTNIFFKDLYFFEQQNNPSLRLIDFAKKLGYKSHTTIQLIFANKRPLNSQLIDTLGEVYMFSKGQRAYLKLLLEKEQSGNTPDLEAKIEALKPPKKRSTHTEVNNYDWASSKFLRLIYVLIGIKGFSEEHAHSMIKGNFTKAEVNTAIKKLQNLGMIEKDLSPESLARLFEERRKIYKKRDRTVSTPISPDNPSQLEAAHMALRWHKKFLLDIHDECHIKNQENIHLSLFMPIKDELISDIKQFLEYKLEEFQEKFAARNGESSNLSSVDFIITKITK